MKPIDEIITEETALYTHKCPQHGDYQHVNAKNMFWSNCGKCVEAEKNIKVADDKAWHDERRKDRIASHLKHSGIPERFISKTLDVYDVKSAGQKRALDFATEYAVNFADVLKTGRSVILCGLPGTGKTHIAIGVGLHVINHGHSVVFATVQRIMRRFKESWRKDSEDTETQVMEDLTAPDLLIIDEIGVQFGSEFEKNAMFDILNTRYENRRPTIMLSNLTQKEVNAFLGDRIFDRLREDGGKCIPFDWASHRGQS